MAPTCNASTNYSRCADGSRQFAAHANDVAFTFNISGMSSVLGVPGVLAKYPGILPGCCLAPPAGLTAANCTAPANWSGCYTLGDPAPFNCSRPFNASMCNVAITSPPFVFPAPFEEAELPLVRDIARFWGSFAANDEPRPTGGRLAWPPHRGQTEASAPSFTMQLDTELAGLEDFKDEDCDFWVRNS